MRARAVLLVPESHWECPNCDFTHTTYEPRPHSQFHNCRGLYGLWVPMVAEGTRCKVTAHEREDYINGDDVQLDGRGRPVANVITTRDDGYDNTVYAPCAVARIGDW